MNTQLFLIPVKHGKEGDWHYQKTIEEGFTPGSIKRFISNYDYQMVITRYTNRKIKAWGARPAKGNNKRTWSKMGIGDKVLIYRNKMYEYFAEVSFKFHNDKLAEYLWGKGPDGQTWEYMYFLDNLNKISVPYESFNKFFDYSPNYNPQGFIRVNPDKVENLIWKYGSIDIAINQMLKLR